MVAKKAELTDEKRMEMVNTIIDLGSMFDSIKAEYRSMLSIVEDNQSSLYKRCSIMSDDKTYKDLEESFKLQLSQKLKTDGVTDKMLEDVYKQAKVAKSISSLATKLIGERMDTLSKQYPLDGELESGDQLGLPLDGKDTLQ